MIDLNKYKNYYIDKTEEEKMKIIVKNKEKYLNKIQILFNMINYLFNNYNNLFDENELEQIKKCADDLKKIYVSLQQNLNEQFELSKFEQDMNVYVELEMSMRNIFYKIFKYEMTNPNQFYSGEHFTFVVHCPTEGTNNEQNENFKVTSATLITDKNMGLYNHGYGKYGFVLDFDLENFIVSSTADLYSSLYSQEEYDHEDYYLQFYKSDKYVVSVDEDNFQMSETCVAIPHYIEQVNVNTTNEVNGELLNYDVEEIYNEILLLNNENVRKIAVFVRTNGDKNFNDDYIAAKKMAEESGLPLIEIDKSLYREKSGLKCLTKEETRSVVKNVAARINSNPYLYASFQTKYARFKLYYNQRGIRYTPANFCLKIYNELRKINQLLTDEQLLEFIECIQVEKSEEKKQEVNFIIRH